MGFLPESDDGLTADSLATLKRNFGLAPGVYRAQLLRPDLVDAQVQMMDRLLFSKGALSRVQKEFILLVVSAENNNSYFPALHCQTLQFLGVKPEQSQQVTIDHREANLSGSDVVLLDFARKLAASPHSFADVDVELLRNADFNDEQILEAVLMVGLTQLLNCIQTGLGIEPDFKPRIIFDVKEVNPPVVSERQIVEPELSGDFVSDDPDFEIVERVRNGETDAFEELVRKHGRRVYRSLLGIVGNPEEAEDALQDAFFKAFQHLPHFEGRSRFSTWLVRIAINTGLQRVRSRKEFDRLDEDDEEFRPRNIQVWPETPEDFYSREELRSLVEKEVMKLPVKYRVALMLRDLEELSTEEAAAALGLSIPGVKARVLRGRLMLRESMVQYFSKTGVGKS
ncbi:MAG TPA: peroxidase-related enzyme [Pyrinomonadaceae bacterium]|nr:peroxidase-related enzyme [Pyrinomonadaceae bacterium]